MHPPSWLGLPALGLIGFLAACAPAQPARSPADNADSGYVDRNTAIASVKRDVWARYQQPIATVDAHNIGRFWVVEARTVSGTGLRYSISRADGLIRERSTFQ